MPIVVPRKVPPISDSGIIYPTEKQWANQSEFITSLYHEHANKRGSVKVVPPRPHKPKHSPWRKGRSPEFYPKIQRLGLLIGEIRQEQAYELEIRISRFLHGTPLKRNQRPVVQIHASQTARLLLRKLRLRMDSEGVVSCSKDHLLSCLVPRPDSISKIHLEHAERILSVWVEPIGEPPDSVWSRISEVCDETIHNNDGGEFWEYHPASKMYSKTRIASNANAQGQVRVQRRFLNPESATIGLIDSDDVSMLLANGHNQTAARLAQLCVMCDVCSGFTHFLPSPADLRGRELPECPSETELTAVQMHAPSVMCGFCERVVHARCIKTSSFEGRAIVERLGRENYDWFCKKCVSESPNMTEYRRFGFKRGMKMTKKLFEDHSKEIARYLGIDKLPCITAIEREYWSLLEGAQDVEVLYASDLSSREVGEGAFPSDFGDYGSWDLRNLAMDKSSVLKHLPGASELQGVTRPWIYLGSHLSSFCWHTEDQHLFSISYLHKGAPKVWYTIPGSYREQFERALANYLPDLNQGGTLHHEMVTMITPEVIKKEFKIPVNRIVQEEGEFVITFPGAYHAGFNTGINLAEAVNIALPEWLSHGLEAVEAYRPSGKESVFSMQELAWSASEAVVSGREDRRQVVDFCVEVLAKAREKMESKMKSVELTGRRFVERVGKCSRCMQVPFFFSCQRLGEEMCVECVKTGETFVMLTRMTVADIATRIDELKRRIPQCQPYKRLKNS